MANFAKIFDMNTNDAQMVSVKNDSLALDDGYCVKLNGLATGELDLYNVVVPAANTDRKLAIVVGQEVSQCGGARTGHIKNPLDYDYPAGTVLDAIIPRLGDRIVMNKTALAGTPAVGEFVVAQASDFQLTASATIPAGALLVFEVESIDYKQMVGNGFEDSVILRTI